MQRFVLTLQLRPDPALAEEYVQRHREVWPGVLESLRASGIVRSEIFRNGYQLFMVLDTTDDFSFERKAAMDQANPTVMQWEKEMAKFQQVDDADTDASKRWVLLESVFQFNA
ncbi:L-rhamnose mutarotase [Terriglobus aquaticus]|uniref:L-rhamnose mutarotase n=1 Tax=Terriglobus aquaticus TaxID=940139 RepID=A0ABW9KNH8_9BACT|nr:L-rhamnose mutarotase [Terriglobus aquaticus]